jgi:hypothetical protein
MHKRKKLLVWLGIIQYPFDLVGKLWLPYGRIARKWPRFKVCDANQALDAKPALARDTAYYQKLRKYKNMRKF